jgi:hypothetical protein
MSGIINPGAVSSVFGRTGAVVAQDNDYFTIDRRTTIAVATGNGTAFTVVGDTTTNTGTASGVLPTATHGSGTQFINSATSTPQGVGGRFINRTGTNISFYSLTAPVRITDERIWIVLSDQVATTAAGSDAPVGNYAGFRFSTQASDTVWQCITQDNVTQNVQSSGVAPVALTTQKFTMLFNDSVPNITFYINNTRVATATTHLPTSGTNLAFYVFGECFTSITGSGIIVGQVRLASDF